LELWRASKMVCRLFEHPFLTTNLLLAFDHLVLLGNAGARALSAGLFNVAAALGVAWAAIARTQ
jgi:hypothetical protein